MPADFPFDPTWIGGAAAALTTTAFAPQAFKACQTRSTDDISLAMFVILIAGIVLWLVYGVLIQDLPLILANSATLLLAGATLAAKIRFS